jgi:hypothetical protein
VQNAVDELGRLWPGTRLLASRGGRPLSPAFLRVGGLDLIPRKIRNLLLASLVPVAIVLVGWTFFFPSGEPRDSTDYVDRSTAQRTTLFSERCREFVARYSGGAGHSSVCNTRTRKSKACFQRYHQGHTSICGLHGAANHRRTADAKAIPRRSRYRDRAPADS